MGGETIQSFVYTHHILILCVFILIYVPFSFLNHFYTFFVDTHRSELYVLRCVGGSKSLVVQYLSPPLSLMLLLYMHTHTHTHTHTLLLFFHTTDGTAAILGVFILAKLLPQTVYARAAHGAKTCVGMDCFFYTHLALVGVEALGAAFACLLVYRSRKLFAQRRRMRLSGH